MMNIKLVRCYFVLCVLSLFTQPLIILAQFYQRPGFGYNQGEHVFNEGDRCVNTVTRLSGYCQNVRNCPHAVKDFQSGVQPQICSYVGSDPIICCASQGSTTHSSQLPNRETIPTNPVPIQTGSVPNHYIPNRLPTQSAPSPTQSIGSSHYRRSLEKCVEYSKLAVERNIVGSFSLDEQVSNTVEKSKCTFSGGGGFIVGGTVTKTGEYPHMAIIGYKADELNIDWFCGASLISYNFILTAAHCTYRRGGGPNVVRLGEQNLKRLDDGASPEDYPIERIIKHPNFKASTKYYDIALMKLSRRVRVTDHIRPACLWQSFNVNYTSVIATGWGLTRDRGKPSDDLLKVSLKMIDNQRCTSIFERFQALRNGILQSQMCAGDDVEERDTCNGDSGKSSENLSIVCSVFSKLHNLFSMFCETIMFYFINFCSIQLK